MPTPTPPPSALDNLNTLASTIEGFVTVVGLTAGGILAYFKLIKDRVYRPRLDISIDAGTVSIDGKKCLLCALSVKNIGTSKIGLVQRGTGLRISEGVIATEPHQEPEWAAAGVFPVLEEHRWFESGETVRHQLFVSLPKDGARALMLEARLVCKRRRQNVSVYSRAVIPPDTQWKGTSETKEAADELEKPLEAG